MIRRRAGHPGTGHVRARPHVRKRWRKMDRLRTGASLERGEPGSHGQRNRQRFPGRILRVQRNIQRSACSDSNVGQNRHLRRLAGWRGLGDPDTIEVVPCAGVLLSSMRRSVSGVSRISKRASGKWKAALFHWPVFCVATVAVAQYGSLTPSYSSRHGVLPVSRYSTVTQRLAGRVDTNRNSGAYTGQTGKDAGPG